MRAERRRAHTIHKLSFRNSKGTIMNIIKKAVKWYCIASSALYSADMANTDAFERLNDITRR